MKTFLEFMSERHEKNIVTESFDNKTIEKACDLIKTILKEHIFKKILVMPGLVENKIGSETVYSKQYLVTDTNNVTISNVFEINWKIVEDKFDVYSIDFFIQKIKVMKMYFIMLKLKLKLFKLNFPKAFEIPTLKNRRPMSSTVPCLSTNCICFMVANGVHPIKLLF